MYPLDFYGSKIGKPKEEINQKLKLLTLSIFLDSNSVKQSNLNYATSIYLHILKKYLQEYEATFFISVIATLVYCTQSQPQLASYGGGRTGQGCHKPL